MKMTFYINPLTTLIELRGERLMDPISSTGTQTSGDPNTTPPGGFGGGGGSGAPGRGMRL